MERSSRWNWDTIFRYLMTAVMIMIGILILCPLARLIGAPGSKTIIPVIQSYVGSASVMTSILSLSLLFILSRHPHYDYFLFSTIGLIAGILSVW